jgi:hypothetical protein
MQISVFMCRIKQYLTKAETLTFFVTSPQGESIIPRATDTIEDIYVKYKDSDDFLTIEVAKESVFG